MQVLLLVPDFKSIPKFQNLGKNLRLPLPEFRKLLYALWTSFYSTHCLTFFLELLELRKTFPCLPTSLWTSAWGPWGPANWKIFLHPHPPPIAVVQLPGRVLLFVTPWTGAHRLLCPWDSPGKNTGVGCHAFLQGIFPTQGLEPRSLTLQADS